MVDAIPLTPEDRGRYRTARGRFDRQYAKVKPGSRAFEVLKRTAFGVFTDGFIHAGNLAYLAIMTLFPFFIVAAAILSLLGQSYEMHHAVESFLHVVPDRVADILRKPIADVLAARTGSLLWLGGLVGLWTVGGFVETIRDIFRRAYGVKSTAPFWRARLGSTLAIVASVVIAMLSFLAQGMMTAIEQLHLSRCCRSRRTRQRGGSVCRAIDAGAGDVPARCTSLFYLGHTRPNIAMSGMPANGPARLFTDGVVDLDHRVAAGGPVASGRVRFDVWQPGRGDHRACCSSILVGLGIVFGAHLNAALAEPDQHVALQEGTARNGNEVTYSVNGIDGRQARTDHGPRQ